MGFTAGSVITSAKLVFQSSSWMPLLMGTTIQIGDFSPLLGLGLSRLYRGARSSVCQRLNLGIPPGGIGHPYQCLIEARKCKLEVRVCTDWAFSRKS